MKYRKKPVVIEARQLLPDNADEIAQWCGGTVDVVGNVLIGTLEGEMKATLYDQVIRGVQDEFYPCKPDIFEATYEAVQSER